MRTLKSGSTHKESRGLGNDVSESLQWPSSAKQSYRVRIDDVTWYVERALADSCCDATSLSRSNWCVHMFLGRPDQSGWSYKHLAAEQMNADGEECAGGRRRVRRQPKEGAQAAEGGCAGEEGTGDRRRVCCAAGSYPSSVPHNSHWNLEKRVNANPE